MYAPERERLRPVQGLSVSPRAPIRAHAFPAYWPSCNSQSSTHVHRTLPVPAGPAQRGSALGGACALSVTQCRRCSSSTQHRAVSAAVSDERRLVPERARATAARARAGRRCPRRPTPLRRVGIPREKRRNNDVGVDDNRGPYGRRAARSRRSALVSLTASSMAASSDRPELCCAWAIIASTESPVSSTACWSQTVSTAVSNAERMSSGLRSGNTFRIALAVRPMMTSSGSIAPRLRWARCACGASCSRRGRGL